MGNYIYTISIMKFAVAALIATVSAGLPPSAGLGHPIIPATREDFDNAKGVWKGDWASYRSAHPNDQDCSISESDNWKGAQDMMDVREPHFQTKLQDSPPTAEKFVSANNV